MANDDARLRRHARPEVAAMRFRDSTRCARPQPALQRIEERLEREEEKQVQDAELHDPRVEHVHPHALAMLPLLRRPQRLERTQQRIHHDHFEHAHDHPIERVVGVLVVVHQADLEQERLHDIDIQQRLQRRNEIIEGRKNEMKHGAPSLALPAGLYPSIPIVVQPRPVRRHSAPLPARDCKNKFRAASGPRRSSESACDSSDQ